MTEEKKFYLTKQGLEKIKKEYEQLKEIRRARTEGEFPNVLHSEEINPEYVSFQENLNFLDDRLNELDAVLKNVELIRIPPQNKRDVIALGASVLIETDDGQTDEFDIIGSLEADPFLGRISN